VRQAGRADIAAGALTAKVAERVYGVMPGDGATRTAAGALRARRLADRLADGGPGSR
jgi:hypothetical protein